MELVNNNVKVVFIGDNKPIEKDIVIQMKSLEKATKNNTGLTLNIALNYGGRDEILRVSKKIAKDVLKGDLKINKLDISTFESYLDTNGQADPDLIIRTAGNHRISNFLLWQISYSELFFTETCWPDFTVAELKEILNNCNNRIRTYGGNEKKLKYFK